jgi:hypothetical protein
VFDAVLMSGLLDEARHPLDSSDGVALEPERECLAAIAATGATIGSRRAVRAAGSAIAPTTSPSPGCGCGLMHPAPSTGVSAAPAIA